MYAAMSQSRFIDALNEQVAYELAASHQYVAIAVYFDAETLPQLAAHFYRQALEERNHAMMLVQYLLDSGERAQIPAVSEPKNGKPPSPMPSRYLQRHAIARLDLADELVDDALGRLHGGAER